MTNALKKLAELIKGNTKSTGSDYTAKVTRVEGNTAYVQLTGAEITDTPVALTINAKEGDMVRVRVNNGKAWITGNDDAPPTDNQAADEARQVAIYAQTQAGSANNAAAEAMRSAYNARISADEAQGSARVANQAANNALSGLSTLEHVIDTVNWFAEHKKASTDTTVNVNKTYYIYDAASGTLTAVEPEGTENPSQEGWYELDEEIANYVATHVATTVDGLSVLDSSNGWRVLISSGAGSYDAGVFLIDQNGEPVAEFGEITRVGKESGAHIVTSETEFSGEDENGAKNFSIVSSGQDTPINYPFAVDKTLSFTSAGGEKTAYIYISSYTGSLILGQEQIEIGYAFEQTGGPGFSSGSSMEYITYGTASTNTYDIEYDGNLLMTVDYDGAKQLNITVKVQSSVYSSSSVTIRYLSVYKTNAKAPSFTFGNGISDGAFSFVAGESLKARRYAQTVVGAWNKEGNYIFAVGNGGGYETSRSNAIEVDWDGNLEVAGEITFGGKKVLLDTPFKQMKVAQQTANNRPLILSFELESGYYDVQQVVFTNTGLEYYGKNRSTQAWERIW